MLLFGLLIYFIINNLVLSVQSTCNEFGKGYCFNGGICSNITGGCLCKTGYSGLSCESFVSLCVPSCLNGGNCSNSECECSVFYSGSYCQTALGACDRFGFGYCLNGGTCSNYARGCLCKTGYTGPSCESLVGCLNNGSAFSCKSNSICNYDGNCTCINGFSGLNCDYKQENTLITVTSIFGGLTIVGVSIATVCVILKRKKKLKKAKEQQAVPIWPSIVQTFDSPITNPNINSNQTDCNNCLSSPEILQAALSIQERRALNMRESIRRGAFVNFDNISTTETIIGTENKPEHVCKQCVSLETEPYYSIDD